MGVWDLREPATVRQDKFNDNKERITMFKEFNKCLSIVIVWKRVTMITVPLYPLFVQCWTGDEPGNTPNSSLHHTCHSHMLSRLYACLLRPWTASPAVCSWCKPSFFPRTWLVGGVPLSEAEKNVSLCEGLLADIVGRKSPQWAPFPSPSWIQGACPSSTWLFYQLVDVYWQTRFF